MGQKHGRHPAYWFQPLQTARISGTACVDATKRTAQRRFPRQIHADQRATKRTTQEINWRAGRAIGGMISEWLFTDDGLNLLLRPAKPNRTNQDFPLHIYYIDLSDKVKQFLTLFRAFVLQTRPAYQYRSSIFSNASLRSSGWWAGGGRLFCAGWTPSCEGARGPACESMRIDLTADGWPRSAGRLILYGPAGLTRMGTAPVPAGRAERDERRPNSRLAAGPGLAWIKASYPTNVSQRPRQSWA